MNPSPKSLLIFSPFFDPHSGGLESFAKELSEHLATPNFPITIFTSQIPKSTPKEENPTPHLTILRFPAFEIIPNFPIPKFWTMEFQEPWQYLKAQSFDFQMTQTRFFLTSLFPLFFSKQTPWIHIEHGSTFVKQSFWVSLSAWIFDHTFGRLVLKKSTTIIAISESVKTFVSKFVSPSKDIQVIHRGLNFPKSLPPKKSNQTPQITFIGRLIQGKGVQDLISALDLVQNQGFKFQAQIIGSGPFEKHLKEMADVRKLDHLKFPGQKSKSEVWQILSQTDIFINPSFTEGLPTSVLEAGFAGCAVLATDVGGTSEIIPDKNHGILIPPKSPQKMADNLIFLLQNSDQRTKMGQNLKTHITQNFTWKTAITKFQNLFK